MTCNMLDGMFFIQQLDPSIFSTSWVTRSQARSLFLNKGAFLWVRPFRWCNTGWKGRLAPNFMLFDFKLLVPILNWSNGLTKNFWRMQSFYYISWNPSKRIRILFYVLLLYHFKPMDLVTSLCFYFEKTPLCIKCKHKELTRTYV